MEPEPLPSGLHLPTGAEEFLPAPHPGQHDGLVSPAELRTWRPKLIGVDDAGHRLG
jgi:hypothetical protein